MIRAVIIQMMSKDLGVTEKYLHDLDVNAFDFEYNKWILKKNYGYSDKDIILMTPEKAKELILKLEENSILI